MVGVSKRKYEKSKKGVVAFPSVALAAAPAYSLSSSSNVSASSVGSGASFAQQIDPAHTCTEGVPLYDGNGDFFHALSGETCESNSFIFVFPSFYILFHHCSCLLTVFVNEYCAAMASNPLRSNAVVESTPTRRSPRLRHTSGVFDLGGSHFGFDVEYSPRYSPY